MLTKLIKTSFRLFLVAIILVIVMFGPLGGLAMGPPGVYVAVGYIAYAIASISAFIIFILLQFKLIVVNFYGRMMFPYPTTTTTTIYRRFVLLI